MSAPLRDRHVLIVDDESVVLTLIGDMLLDLGASSVATAMDLAEAVELARVADLDVAVLDINLSGQTSYPIAEVLRARRIPFLFATGYGSTGHDQAWTGTPTLAKPFSCRDLERVLAGLLSGAR